MTKAVALGELVQPVGRWQPNGEAVIEYLDIEAIDRVHKVVREFKRVPVAEAPSRARQAIQPNDVVVSTVRPNLNAVAQIPRHEGVLVASTGFAVLRPDPELLSDRYLFHFLRTPSFVGAMTKQATGASYPAVSAKDVLATCIPLPALAEQRRIASILDTADAIRRRRAQATKMLDDLLRSVFLEMFGDPVTNPKGWPLKRFDEVCKVQLGKMLSAKSRTGQRPVKYLRNANVQWRRFELEDILEMDFSDAELEKFSLQNGDLLICEGGEVGRTAIWHGELEGCSFQKSLHRVRLPDGVATPEYVQEYLFHLAERGGLVKATTSATIAHLTKEKLESLPLLVPPIGLQREFSHVVMRAESMRSSIEGSGVVVNALCAGIASQAFEG